MHALLRMLCGHQHPQQPPNFQCVCAVQPLLLISLLVLTTLQLSETPDQDSRA